MDGYDEIVKAAKHFKQKAKTAAGKKDTKQARKQYLEKQAMRVSRAFRHWIDNRRRDFQKSLAQQVQRWHMGENPTRTWLARCTQPEEKAFLFLKVMDKIGEESKIVKKKNKHKQKHKDINVATAAVQEQPQP